MVNDEREFLERSLADLDAERAAGDIADDDYKLLKERYQAKLDASRDPSGGDRHHSGTEKTSGVARKVGIGIVVAVLAVGAGLLVARSSGSRGQGESITGESPADREAAAAGPLERAAELAAAGDVLGALEVYDEVLAEDPEDPAALTYKGWLLRNVGDANDETELAARGVALLEQASQVDPTFSEAWLFLGIVYYRDQDDPTRAVDALRLAIANDPIPQVEAAARELLAEIEEKT